MTKQEIINKIEELKKELEFTKTLPENSFNNYHKEQLEESIKEYESRFIIKYSTE